MLSFRPTTSLYDPSIKEVRDATPVNVSGFYVTRPYNVPWSVLPTTFILETSNPAAECTININNTEVFTTVPGASVSYLSFNLLKGPNHFEIQCGSDVLFLDVTATALQSWYDALGRQLYITVDSALTEVQQQLASPWTTRLSSFLYPYSDLFFPSQMPRMQQTRMAILASWGQRLGMSDGVRMIASAISYTTPWSSNPSESEFSVPGRDPIYAGVTTYPTRGEIEGRLLDIWTPNVTLAAKLALQRLALNVGAPDVPYPKPMELIDADDYQVILKTNGDTIEVHRLNPLTPDAYDLNVGASCEETTFPFITFKTRIDGMMNWPQMPFDEVVTRPLGFGFWDSGGGLDGGGAFNGGDSFDNYDPDDPLGDGFLGVSLSRRLDYACFDTRIQRAQRLQKFVFPIASSSSKTPEVPTGYQTIVDGSASAPAPELGATTIWLMSWKRFFQEGDRVRMSNPNADLEIASAWPLRERTPGSAIVLKNDTGVTTAFNGTTLVATGPAGFFTMNMETKGLYDITTGERITIVSCSENALGTQTYATLVGNPSFPVGAVDAEIYEPCHDPDDTTLAPFSGRVLYETTFTSALTFDLSDREEVDYHVVPRVREAASMGDSFVLVDADSVPLPGDRLYINTTDWYDVVGATDTGVKSPLSGLTVYDMELASPLAANVSDGDLFYNVSRNQCYPNGAPVTPLTLYAIYSSSYMVP